jgi:predicted nucleic acid-binding protein
VEVILDTNAVSDFADANQRLLNCLQQSAADIHLPVIVLGEYRYGVKSSRLRVARERWLDETRIQTVGSDVAVYPRIMETGEVLAWYLTGWSFESTRFNVCISAL